MTAPPSPQHHLAWQREPELISRWADGLRLETPLPEYPRPQFVRSQWENLNGVWDFLGGGPQPPELPVAFTEQALVPSQTQAATSCLAEAWTRGWYRKSIELPADWQRQRVIVHFEAIGGVATVFCNGQHIGDNTGSFKRCSYELIADQDGRCELLVHFDDTDPRIPRGKPDHISGLWQTVWMEPLPQHALQGFQQTPDIDEGRLTLTADVASDASDLCWTATAHTAGKTVATVSGPCDAPLQLDLPDARLWSPEDPFLYDLTLELKQGDTVVDRVESYFGMRKISRGDIDGLPRLLLNNTNYFQIGLLDQGEWPESLFTPPSDESLRWEVQTAKDMGYNVLRKHVKIESDRWYYWCDKLGMLVWQDLPHQAHYYNILQKTPEEKKYQHDALRDMIQQFYNHPSIICWAIFNESWGQFDPQDMAKRAKAIDTSRLINATSHVWPNDLGRARYNVDLYDNHCYSRQLSIGNRYDSVPTVHLPHALGEFGGIGYTIHNHVVPNEPPKAYGVDAYSADELLCHYKALILQAREMRTTHHLCAVIYTELTDWQAEVNGFITYDREVIKVEIAALREINQLFTDPTPANHAATSEQ